MGHRDDSAAGSTVENIKQWWDELVKVGSLYDYYSNSSKTHILTKPDQVQSVRDAFKIPTSLFPQMVNATLEEPSVLPH